MKKKVWSVIVGMIFLSLMMLSIQSSMNEANTKGERLDIITKSAMADGSGQELGYRCWCTWYDECSHDGNGYTCAPPYYLVCEDYLTNCPAK